MKDLSRVLWLGCGMLLGALGVWLYSASLQPAFASNDRQEDFVLCTGPVTTTPRGGVVDGVWLLDYRAGKLLGSVIDQSSGKIQSWAEVDLVSEFGVQPKQKVHFMMTTGNILPGQAALYLAETTTGKLGVYTMSPRPDGKGGAAIRRHDMVLFRQATP